MLNRKNIVARHYPTLNALDNLSPFSVGNGEFAFTADITGLQTFPDAYDNGMPLHTMSNWGWHSFPNPQQYRIEDSTYPYSIGEREVGYASNPLKGGDYSSAGEWLRANPHRLDLGRIGLILRTENGEAVAPEALEKISQTLDLWTGRLDSQFSVEGQQFQITTVCHPKLDLIAVRIQAPESNQKIGVRLAFPYPAGEWKRADDWQKQEAHQTTVEIAENRADFQRVLDEDSYSARLQWAGEVELKTAGNHEFELWSSPNGTLEFSLAFAPSPIEYGLPLVENVISAAAEHWEDFWQNGAAIDFSGSTDVRWRELERRVVLSQYVTAINCSGSLPPQETGLVCNSWFGKFHLEMHWWHAVHFAFWNRLPLLEQSLEWYKDILPVAQENASRQGYRGARWTKMVGPDGQDSPSSVAVFLIWQQPHPLYYAELCYRECPQNETLELYREVVFETAEWMASYARWDAENKRYVLGPAMIPAQESYGHQRNTNLNPTYELAYWHWALGIAQEWRQRCGLEREPHWDHVRDHLAKPPVRDGIYDAIETPPHLIRRDHPSMLAALGFLPQTPLIDTQIMQNTLESVLESWDWATTWGWDYPMIAFTAARLGQPHIALDALLLDSPKNRYLPNGHNYQDARLPLYLPGNGGLLAAIAMMVGGWDGAPTQDAPGFPTDGSWKVVSENFSLMP